MALSVEERRMNENSSGLLKFQLVDETGKPLLKADIATLKITLCDVLSGNIINSRDDQNAVDVNNVAIQADLTISGVTQANPAVVTFTTDHNLEAGMRLAITGIVGMTELNGRSFEVVPVATDATKVELRGEDSTGYTAYSSAGTGAAGLVQWSIQQLDNPIDGTTATAVGSYERHQVLFEYTFPATPTLGGNFLQDLYVLSLKGAP